MIHIILGSAEEASVSSPWSLSLFGLKRTLKTLEGGGTTRWKEPEFQNDQVVGG